MAWSIPANWITFEAAKNAFLKGTELPEGHKSRFDGLGFFIFREKDAEIDIYAVDLDHCRNPETGEIDPWAKDVLVNLNSYSEVSPSGTGIHIFVGGMLPEGSKNTNDQMKDKNRIEVFVNKHHITMTGDHILGTPGRIEDRSDIIKALYDEVMEVKASKKQDNKQNKLKSKRIIYDCKAEAKKKYVAAAIEDEISILKSTAIGNRNNQLNRSAFALGQFVGAHFLGRREAERELRRAAEACGMTGNDGIEVTIRSGLDDGETYPREIPELGEPIQSPLPQITVKSDEKKTTQPTARKEDDEKSLATILVDLAIKNSTERWHTPDGEAYITVFINSHREHYKISTKSTKIRMWLGRLGSAMLEKTPGLTAIRDAVNVLAGIAVYDGKEYEMHVRKAEVDGKIFVDIGDQSWRAIEISSDGWKIINECPVKFRRSKNSLPLPIPEKGGEIDELRELINAQTDENWILILAWLSQAFWCRGPYAHLYLRGTQGTAKSYMMQTLKAISDPSLAIKRRLPKSERDTAIALGSESIPCFDNLSGVEDNIADLLCVASTGGVSTQRALFTDDEESIIRMKCPVIANGIEDLGQRGDLLDRTIVLDLEPIPESERRTEKEIAAEIREKKARLFGCLLDITVEGLSNVESVDLQNPPRMADFAEWACACLGDAADRFIEIYASARTNASIDLAEMNRLPSAIYGFVITRDGKSWKGSASSLLSALNEFMIIRPGLEPREWPDTPDKLGSELRRFSQALESKGVFTTYKRPGGRKTITLAYRGSSDTEEAQQKTILDATCASCVSSKLKEENIRGTPRDTPRIIKSDQNICGTEAQKALDNDSDRPGGTSDEAQTPLGNSKRIQIAAQQEYGINDWVDPRQIAAKLKLPLAEVVAWLGANYEKSSHGYIQKKFVGLED